MFAAPPTVLVLLWCVAGVAALAAVLPPLLHLAGLSRYRAETDEDPAALEPTGDDPFYAGVCAQLADLGLRPLGTHRDLVWFFGPHWRWSCSLKVFGSRQRRCFACVYRLIQGEPVRVAFLTCFLDGGHVWTGNHMESLKVVDDDYLRWGVQTSDLTLLLEEHRKVVEWFAATGTTAADHDSLPVLRASMERHVPRSVRRHRDVPGMIILEALFWLAGPPLLLAYSLGQQWLLPVGVLASLAVRHVLHRWPLHQEGDERRQQVAREGIVRYGAGTQAGDFRRAEIVRASEGVMEPPPPGSVRRG
jgi:hypothetical protein